MKTITKEFKVYGYNELSEDSKERVKNNYIKDNDYNFVTEYLEERLAELLKENNIDGDGGLYSSLSYSQGDGCMFYGSFYWKGLSIVVKHEGYYYHSYSKNIDIDYPEEMKDNNINTLEKEFENIYQTICKDLEKYGYDLIEQEDSEENIKEYHEANDSMFLEDGSLFIE